MSANIRFYDSELNILKNRYKHYRRIIDADKKPSELADILTQLKAINQDNCPENKKALFTFEIEEFQLHILYTAIFISKIPLLKEHEASAEELLARYKKLIDSAEYQKLKSSDAKKQKIERYAVKLESELGQNQRVNVFR